jgi:sugar phosphate isomerase/epimerase
MVAALTKDRLNIHQVTLMECTFRESIECLARHGITETAVWRAKLDEVGLPDALSILNDNGVSVASLCAGGFTADIAAADPDPVLDDNRRWLEEAAALGARSLVTITGGLRDGERDLAAARERAVAGLDRLVPHARAAGVKLALEPLHPMVCGYRSVISTVAEALDVLDMLDADDVLGVAVDSYAVWWEADLQGQIRRAGPRLLNLHVSDWLRETKSVRFDRGMPGDGVIDNRSIRSWAEAAGYRGRVEVEIFCETYWWQRDPDEVVATVLARMEAHL